jgi:opacity protein-like surface antigen
VNRVRRLLLGAFLLSLALPFAYAKEDKQQKKQDAINQAHSAQVEAAKKAALDWLTVIDAGKYGEGWKQSATFLQTHFPQVEWEKHLDQMRKPLDPFIDRTLSNTEYRDQLPGLPPGQYVAIVWESYFGTKHQMLESVVMTLDNGQWKPIGYAVQ